MVGADRASGSGLDLQGYARYQNRSSVSYIWLLNLCLFVYRWKGLLITKYRFF